jgi:transcriptional regulator with XRE-family HTH domain
MPRHPFGSFLERKYLQWQIDIGERKSQAEFARLMGVSRASVTNWMNGENLPDVESAKKIATVLGNEVFDVLGFPTPNPYLQKINQVFERLSAEHQQKLAEMAERYVVSNNEENAKRAPKERKTSPR